jgi:hypothetical protein
MDFTPLDLPNAPLKLSQKEGVFFVLCEIRRKKIVLTPEEWVRQHVIHYLIKQKQVPQGLIASEIGVKIHKLGLRCDIVVYGKDKKIKILVECKAPEMKITEQTLHQIAHYNAAINADYLWLTNGISHHFIYINRNKQKLEHIEELPNFDLII